MKLKDYLTHLAYGELSNLSYVNPDTHTIYEDKVPFVVDCINEALLRLYTKFILKENELYLETSGGITNYYLTSDHTFSSEEDKTEDKYIFNTEDRPFLDDVVKVLSVYNEYGWKLPLNDLYAEYSVFTPMFNVIQVPKIIEGMDLAVSYQAKHPELKPDNLEQELELPTNLNNALYSYVAYLIHSNMNTEVAVTNAQKYLAQYNSIIDEITLTDTANMAYSQISSKFNHRGWC